jgi:uncharacterized RDD family membrane protein YckC
MDRPVATARPAHLGWRLLALLYDFFPLLALWFATSLVVYLVRGNVPVQPGSFAAYTELVLLWLLTGAYFVISWRRGGQTIGMRPWRLKVIADDGQAASWGALCLRYVVAMLSLFVGPWGYLYALFDEDRECWHDMAAGTRFVRLDPPTPTVAESTNSDP